MAVGHRKMVCNYVRKWQAEYFPSHLSHGFTSTLLQAQNSRRRWNQLLEAFYRTFPALDKRRHKELDKSRGTEHVSLASDQIDSNAGKVIPVDSMEVWAYDIHKRCYC
jgi:hypothetical protein